MTAARHLTLLLVAVALTGMSEQSAAPMARAETADAPAVHTVLVELFTSQGCSSCPPADRLLTKLGQERDGRVVPLSFHVDFWNHLGWSDPFSRADWTQRQVAYAKTFRLSNVYTPEAVVDGRMEMVGSDENRLGAAIKAAAALPSAEISLGLEPTDSKVLVTADIDVPEALRGRKLDLMVAVFETTLVTNVGRGENSGRVLRNDYVVRSLERAARIVAAAPDRVRKTAALALAREWKRSELGVAAFLQDPKSLEILGANSRLLSDRRPHG